MSAVVRVAPQFRTHVAGRSKIEVECPEDFPLHRVLAEALLFDHLVQTSEHVHGEAARLHDFVRVFVDDEDVSFLDGLATPVPDGAEVTVMMAVAGG